MNISIDVDARELSKAMKAAPMKVRYNLQTWANTTAAKAERHIKTVEAPVDTGQLQSSISVKPGDLSATVSPRGLKHAYYVHEGTGIYAKNGKGRKTPWFVVLEDWGSSGFGFWTKGQKPNPYMERGFKYIKPIGELDAKRTLDKIVRDI